MTIFLRCISVLAFLLALGWLCACKDLIHEGRKSGVALIWRAWKRYSLDMVLLQDASGAAFVVLTVFALVILAAASWN